MPRPACCRRVMKRIGNSTVYGYETMLGFTPVTTRTVREALRGEVSIPCELVKRGTEYWFLWLDGTRVYTAKSGATRVDDYTLDEWVRRAHAAIRERRTRREGV